MDDDVPGRVAVSRRIGAPAVEVFRVLADPRRHLELDGSGMLREVRSGGVISGVGDVFVMAMHYAPIGDYEMVNHVVSYEPGRRIGWEPKPGPGHPDERDPGPRWRHRWVFELVPDGPDATVVTEIYDCSRSSPDQRRTMDDGRVWLRAMARTLRRLDDLCTPTPA